MKEASNILTNLCPNPGRPERPWPTYATETHFQVQQKGEGKNRDGANFAAEAPRYPPQEKHSGQLTLPQAWTEFCLRTMSSTTSRWSRNWSEKKSDSAFPPRTSCRTCRRISTWGVGPTWRTPRRPFLGAVSCWRLELRDEQNKKEKVNLVLKKVMFLPPFCFQSSNQSLQKRQSWFNQQASV